jgi:hypothetical protein
MHALFLYWHVLEAAKTRSSKKNELNSSVNQRLYVPTWPVNSSVMKVYLAPLVGFGV